MFYSGEDIYFTHNVNAYCKRYYSESTSLFTLNLLFKMRAREIELEGFVDNSWFIKKNLKSTEQQMLRGCSEQFYLHS